jgi:hypothetical protein
VVFADENHEEMTISQAFSHLTEPRNSASVRHPLINIHTIQSDNIIF